MFSNQLLHTHTHTTKTHTHIRLAKKRNFSNDFFLNFNLVLEPE